MACRKLTKREIEMFGPICELHGCDMNNSRVLICEGRKAGLILNFGSVPSAKCFVHEAPTQSFKQPREVGSTTLLPDGWKMAVNVRGFVIVGEIRYSEDMVPMYQFSRYEGACLIEVSDFFSSPTPAFTQVLNKLGKTGERPNGKLVLGVQYGEPQRAMRQAFLNAAPQVNPDVLALFNDWLHAVDASEPVLPPTTTTVGKVAGGGALLSRKRSSFASVESDPALSSPHTKKRCDDFHVSSLDSWMNENDLYSMPILDGNNNNNHHHHESFVVDTLGFIPENPIISEADESAFLDMSWAPPPQDLEMMMKVEQY